jgi:putative membrane protein
MENFKNYAVASIAICSIAMCGVTNSAILEHQSIVFTNYQQSDTLSTEQFIQQMSVGSSKEINLSKLAKERTKNSKVREYAIKMMDACILANGDLKPLAVAKNMTLTDSTTVEPDEAFTSLSKSKDKGFDKKYLEASLASHSQTIAMLEKGVMSTDTTVAGLATKFLLVWRRNMEGAQFLSKSMKNGKMLVDGPPKEE